jgi:putative PEP-CTERM system TPR-repeat lipoprotein
MLGRVELQEGDRDSAQKLFEDALELDPDNATASGGLALVALLDNDLEGARTNFEAALDANPGDLETSLNLAILYERLGERDNVRGVLEDAIAANASAVAPRLRLAEVNLAEGRAGDALALLQPVAERSEDPELLGLLTTAYLAAEQPSLAGDAGRRLLAADANSPASLAIVAQADVANGSLGAARGHMEKALELAPDNIPLRKQYIEVLARQREPGLALQQIAALPEDVQGETPILLLRGRLAIADGDAGDAVSLFEQAFAQESTAVNLLLLSEARWATGEREQVVATLTDWLKTSPEDALVRNALATRQLGIGDEEAARMNYELLVEQEPNSVSVRNNLAWLMRESDPAQALEHIERALELAPESLQVQDTYAMVLLANGEADRALNINSRILDRVPGNPDIRFNRAQILARAGRQDEAMALLEELVVGPSFASMADAEALLASLRGA